MDVSIQVNGQARALRGPATLADLLRELSLDPGQVVVELNREIIRRPRLDAVALKPGDSVELVHFVGGG